MSNLGRLMDCLQLRKSLLSRISVVKKTPSGKMVQYSHTNSACESALFF
jgi:hypothetical protein